MPSMFRILVAAVIALGVTGIAGGAGKPRLVVYTYDSFVSEWGPGPQIEPAFEARCDCDVEFVGLEDGVSMLNRLRLEGRNTRADLLLGIDTSLTAVARATGLFVPHDLELKSSALPQPWTDELFLPYDYGYFAFVYNRERIERPPTSLAQLVENPQGPTLLLQDPRTSTPGLGLLLWVKKVYGDRAREAWAKLAPRVVTVSKGWSEAYGLFLKGEADMVLSYSTSPAYHLIAEQDSRFAAARFAEGHYQQIEVAGIVAGSDRQALAREFLEFMLSEAFQRVIPTTNWMYPATLPRAQLPPEFDQLIDPTPALRFDDDIVAAQRQGWIDEWLEVMSR